MATPNDMLSEMQNQLAVATSRCGSLLKQLDLVKNLTQNKFSEQDNYDMDEYSVAQEYPQSYSSSDSDDYDSYKPSSATLQLPENALAGGDVHVVNKRNDYLTDSPSNEAHEVPKPEPQATPNLVATVVPPDQQAKNCVSLSKITSELETVTSKKRERQTHTAGSLTSIAIHPEDLFHSSYKEAAYDRLGMESDKATHKKKKKGKKVLQAVILPAKKGSKVKKGKLDKKMKEGQYEDPEHYDKSGKSNEALKTQPIKKRKLQGEFPPSYEVGNKQAVGSANEEIERPPMVKASKITSNLKKTVNQNYHQEDATVANPEPKPQPNQSDSPSKIRALERAKLQEMQDYEENRIGQMKKILTSKNKENKENIASETKQKITVGKSDKDKDKQVNPAPTQVSNSIKEEAVENKPSSRVEKEEHIDKDDTTISESSLSSDVGSKAMDSKTGSLKEGKEGIKIAARFQKTGSGRPAWGYNNQAAKREKLNKSKFTEKKPDEPISLAEDNKTISELDNTLNLSSCEDISLESNASSIEKSSATGDNPDEQSQQIEQPVITKLSYRAPGKKPQPTSNIKEAVKKFEQKKQIPKQVKKTILAEDHLPPTDHLPLNNNLPPSDEQEKGQLPFDDLINTLEKKLSEQCLIRKQVNVTPKSLFNKHETGGGDHKKIKEKPKNPIVHQIVRRDRNRLLNPKYEDKIDQSLIAMKHSQTELKETLSDLSFRLTQFKDAKRTFINSLPFVLTQSTSKSYHLGVNIQQSLSMIKRFRYRPKFLKLDQVSLTERLTNITEENHITPRSVDAAIGKGALNYPLIKHSIDLRGAMMILQQEAMSYCSSTKYQDNFNSDKMSRMSQPLDDSENFEDRNEQVQTSKSVSSFKTNHAFNMIRLLRHVQEFQNQFSSISLSNDSVAKITLNQ